MNREAPSRHEQFPLLERNVWHWQRYEGYKKKHTSAISVRYDTKGRANAKKKKKKTYHQCFVMETTIDNYVANFCSTRDSRGSANLRPFSKVRRIELDCIWQFKSYYRAIKSEKLYLARKNKSNNRSTQCGQSSTQKFRFFSNA